MLRGKRIMAILSTTLIFSTSGLSETPFHALATEVVKDNNIGMVQVDRFGLLIEPIFEKLEKDKIEFEQKKAEEEQLTKQKELEEQKKNEPQWQEYIVSYYTGLDEENFEGCGGRNCLNKPLERGMIANNSLPLGTKIFLDNDYGTRTVQDRGSSRFNDSNRIDLYVERWSGESKEQWKKRAESYGIRHIRGYIIK